MYLLNNETITVVDSGCCPEDGKLIIDYIQQELGRSPGDIGIILLTHGHPDHAGGASYLVRQSGAPIAKCPAKGNEILEWTRVIKDMFTRQHLEMVFKMYRKAGNRLIPRMGAPVKTRNVGDGDIIPNAVDWQVLHTPGHSYDSICLYNEHAAALLSGDTIVSIAAVPKPSSIRVSPELFDLSMERISHLNVEHLLPGHGQPLSGGKIDHLFPGRKRGV